MRVHDDGTVLRALSDRSQPLLEVVVEEAPSIDVAPRPAARAVAALVVRVGIDPGRSQVIADVLVPSRVLTETVDEQQRRPWIGRRPVPCDQLDAVRRCDTTDERGHEAARMHDQWVCLTDGSKSAIKSSCAATSSSTRTSG